MGGSCGTQTAGFCWYSANTMTYDGTSWTEQSDTNIRVQENGGCGTTTAALHNSGEGISPTPPGKKLSTEEWNDPFEQTVSFDTT